MTIITLSNGKKVGNFSSPHPFTFEDGSILPAVSNEEAERLQVDFLEESVGKAYPKAAFKEGDIELHFTLSDEVLSHMDQWIELYKKGQVDIVFCPLPMIIALKEQYIGRWVLLSGPFRAIRMVDRIKKLVSINKQCI